ncbi:MAG: hypothetical protein AAGD06_09340 [Acidobacteriota bacterium]
MRTTRQILPLLILAGLTFAPLVACSGGGEATGETPAADVNPAPAAPTTDSPAADTAPGLAPVTSRSATLGEERIQAPGASFAIPAEWRSEPPSSSMRLAQATIPGSGGDGQLTVFYFGPGGGGGVDDNLARWVGQVEADAGTAPSRDTFSVDDTFLVTWVEVAGTIKPSTMGVGPTEPQPGSRLQGAVVEGPEGPWFFKITGPSATLEENRDAFLAMLRSAQAGGDSV